jgi:hypothetical protein
MNELVEHHAAMASFKFTKNFVLRYGGKSQNFSVRIISLWTEIRIRDLSVKKDQTAAFIAHAHNIIMEVHYSVILQYSFNW